MEQNSNPVNMRGGRNLYCPYYNDCLSQAAKLHWETWSCFDCHIKQIYKVKARQPISSTDPKPYFSLAPDV